MGKLACWLVISLVVGAPVSAGILQVYDNDLENFGRLRELDSATGVESTPAIQSSCNSTPPDVLFSVGFAAGLAFKDGVLHGVDGTGAGPFTLFRVEYNEAGCAAGVPIGPVGAFANLESLAYCPDGFFYSQRFDFGAHVGQLVRVNAATGAGTNIGSSMASDVRLLGMDCDDAGTLWAVSAGHASRPMPELFTVSRTSGVATSFGATGAVALSHQSLAIDRSSPTLRLFAAGTSLHEIDPTSGAATLVAPGVGDVWASATTVPEPRFASAGALLALWVVGRLRPGRSVLASRFGGHLDARSA